MPFPRDEIDATMQRYVAVREAIDAGQGTWADLAPFFVDDAVFIDPAWGRVEGIEEMKRTVFGDAMVGFEEWKFPIEFYAIDGDTIVVKWKQVLPGRKDDGRPFEQSGVSTIVYAGNGKFSYEEDLLNMVHVLEDMKASKCPVPDVAMPPRHPNRDFSRPRNV
ncbi:MAG TPA: nuclear transport factor 2 family protein [Acidimicrobiia bacterium]|nr:nuclear transport factor 2 family protein [Acidimicrobiia bacterium]